MAAATVRLLCEAVQTSADNADGWTGAETPDGDNTLDAGPSQIAVPIILYTAENI